MRILRSFILAICFCFSLSAAKAQTVVDLVDLEIGTVRGNTFYGSAMPFSMCKVGPTTEYPYPTNGYTHDKMIKGFSHNHLSGTGGQGRYGNLLFTPHSGPLMLNEPVYAQKNDEYAAPGYYYVMLGREGGDVTVKLTSTEHCALHSYTFFDWSKSDRVQANVTVDITEIISRFPGEPKKAFETSNGFCRTASIEIVDDRTLKGFGEYGGGFGGENPYTVYFYAQFDKPFKDSEATQEGAILEKAKGNLKVGLSWYFAQHETLMVKVGISERSIAQAKENLKQEIKDWDFYSVRNANYEAWLNHLDRIKTTGGTHEERVAFYTALYHGLLMPTDKTGQTNYRPESKPFYDEHYCLWDVFRTTMPLHTLIYPERQDEMLRSLLLTYKEKGWLPDAWMAGDFGQNQGGSNADVVFADAFVKGFGTFDKKLALEAMLKNRQKQSDNPVEKGRYAKEYNKLGYVTSTTALGASSRSLEYAYNDYCIAQVAAQMGKKAEANALYSASLNYRKLFHPKGFMWAKDKKGKWMPNPAPGFAPKKSWESPYFYEGTPYDYTTYVPHDVPGLAKLMGGPDKLENWLDKLFEDGHFGMGNEPSFLTPYLYNYIAKQDKTAHRIDQLRRDYFTVGRRGLPGQDDSGALSTYYVWACLGIYPVAGQAYYLVGSPLFEESSLDLADGKTLRMKAENHGRENIYVQKMAIDGKPWMNGYLSQSQMMSAQEIVFEMGPKPNPAFGKSAIPFGLPQWKGYGK